MNTNTVNTSQTVDERCAMLANSTPAAVPGHSVDDQCNIIAAYAVSSSKAISYARSNGKSASGKFFSYIVTWSNRIIALRTNEAREQAMQS